MSTQLSRKSGKRSDAQKRAAARKEYDPMPAAHPVAGASGAEGRVKTGALPHRDKAQRPPKP